MASAPKRGIRAESFLQNNERPALRAARVVQRRRERVVARRAYELIARGNNLHEQPKAYGSGYASGGVSYYFVVPPRNLFLTAKATF